MNFSTPLGLIVGVLVVVITAVGSIKNPQVFLSPHAALIVIGGTFAASLVCFRISVLFDLTKVFLRQLLGQGKLELQRTISEIVSLSSQFSEGKDIESLLPSVTHPFLKDALLLMNENTLTGDSQDEILQKRIEIRHQNYKRTSLTFKTISKFPPAFGLVGTTMGMIGLLQGLGEANAFENLGPTMSLALVATFYGLVISNLILGPLGENLSQASEEDLKLRKMILLGVRLIREKSHPLQVEEFLKSYLTPTERMEYKKAA